MKSRIHLFLLLLTASFLLSAGIASEVEMSELAKRMSLPETENDGDWSAPYAESIDTAEAEVTLRFGDIDNFGQTWRIIHDPFSGEIASPLVELPSPINEYSDGTDQLFNYETEEGRKDGVLNVSLPLASVPDSISNASLQFYFATDGQTAGGNRWEVSINGEALPELSAFLGRLTLQPKQGYIVYWRLPLAAAQSGQETLDVSIRSQGNSAFAVDFFKILLNEKSSRQGADVTGVVRKKGSGKPLSNVEISCQGRTVLTDEKGAFRFRSIPGGATTVVLGVLEGEEVRRIFQHYLKEEKKLYFAL